MADINLALNVSVVGGPQITVSRSKVVEAYDKIDVVIDPGGAGANEKTVNIQPGSAALVNLLMIKSNIYGPEITYTVGDGTTDSSSISLDEPHLYSGSGMMSLFIFSATPATNPKSLNLKFKNTNTAGNATKKASIEILVGRDATP